MEGGRVRQPISHTNSAKWMKFEHRLKLPFLKCGTRQEILYVVHIHTWRNSKFRQEERVCRRLLSSRFSPLLFSHGPREKRRFGVFWNSKAAGKHSKAHFTARWDLFLTIYVYLIRLFCFLSVSWIYVLFFTVYLTLCARAQGPLI